MADEDYDDIIGAAVLAAAGTGPLIALWPVPADPTAMAAVWTTMTVGICRRARHEIDGASARRLALGLAGGVGAYYSASKVFTGILVKFPLTIGPAIAANAALNALYTVRLGGALVDLMEKEDFSFAEWDYVMSFLLSVLAPRPTAAEVRRVRAMLDRLRGRGAA